jgi:hypothetical protein
VLLDDTVQYRAGREPPACCQPGGQASLAELLASRIGLLGDAIAEHDESIAAAEHDLLVAIRGLARDAQRQARGAEPEELAGRA